VPLAKKVAARYLREKLRAARGPQDESDFWSWARKYYPQVRNPTQQGRQMVITIDTLKGYADKGDPDAAKEVERYRKQYEDVKAKAQQERGQGAEQPEQKTKPDKSQKEQRKPETYGEQESFSSRKRKKEEEARRKEEEQRAGPLDSGPPKYKTPSSWKPTTNIMEFVDVSLQDMRSKGMRKKYDELDEKLSRNVKSDTKSSPEDKENEKIRRGRGAIVDTFQDTLSQEERMAYDEGVKGLQDLYRYDNGLQVKNPNYRAGKEMRKVLRSIGVKGAGGLLQGKPKRDRQGQPGPLESAVIKAMAFSQEYFDRAGMDSVRSPKVFGDARNQPQRGVQSRKLGEGQDSIPASHAWMMLTHNNGLAIDSSTERGKTASVERVAETWLRQRFEDA